MPKHEIIPVAAILLDPAVRLIMAGATIMGHFVVGLLFFQFWRRTRDRLFAIFAIAFWVMTVQRLLVSIPGEESESQNVLFYGLRLAAFVLILVAIIDKNRSKVVRPAREL